MSENGNPRDRAPHSARDARAKDRQTIGLRRQAKLLASVETGADRLAALVEGQVRSTDDVRATVET
ncbi:hypothetical protein G6O46_23770, partial [Salmonella enterica subsp. enterica serovar Enteritidis]|uniref:hypothetical protein n=1 Tax=Salmonella enterica TaxID=28901 RepID=UPI0016541DBC